MKISRSAALIGRLFDRLRRGSPARPAVLFGSLVALAGLAPAAHAIVVVSPAANLVVPPTTAGIYINLVTGAAGTASATTGWDINPWGSGSLFIYAATGGGIVSSTNSPVASLAAGATIGSASTFVASPGAASFGSLAGQWTLNASNNFGFRFVGDDTLTHYGYGTMIVGATPLIRSIGQLYYESAANTGITIGAVAAVPEPSSAAMLLAGLAVSGGLAMRRTRRSNRR